MENQASGNGGILSRQQKKYIAIIIPIVVAAMSIISYVRYLDFYTSNWDLGIEMQMLGDNFHGYLLFEAGDFETYGVLSHLEIHSTYIAILYSLAYQDLSEPVFLFISQAIFFSISVLPLNAISRHYGLTDRQSFFVTIIYVTNVGFIASQMYDFHWMSLIPLEILTLFFLLTRKRYLSSVAVIVIGSLTLEVFPLLALGILLFFYYEDIISKGNLKNNYLTVRSISIIFLSALSVGIFLLIKEAQYEILPSLLHNNIAVGILRNNYPENLYPTSFSLYSTGSAILYWGILYSSLGLIPLFYRRHLLIALPWLYESIIVVPQYATIQDQYSFIALPALFIGLILAIGKGNREPAKFNIMLKTAVYSISICLSAVFVYEFTFFYYPTLRVFLSVVIALIVFMVIILMNNSRSLSSFYRKRKSAIGYAMGIVLILLVLFNLVIGPLDPLNEEKTVDSGYAFSYSLNPEYQDLVKMKSLIPKNASMITSDNLFPYVAYDPNAFSFYWNTPANLSFFIYDNLSLNFSFSYVLIDKSQVSYIPNNVLIHIRKDYGLESIIYTALSYPGDICLYKKGYNGPTIAYF
jgi:uncharacterized membrane protein